MTFTFRGEEVCLSIADILRTRGEGILRCGRPHFLVQNTTDFRNLWYVRTNNGGSIFRDFVGTSFMDGP